MNRFIYRVLLSIFTLIFTSINHGFSDECDTKLKDEIKSLKSLLERREEFQIKKENRIETIKQMLGETPPNSPKAMVLNEKIADEYLSYQFDSACYYINKNISIAKSLKDTKSVDEGYIELARLYSSSGSYHEASVLFEKLDTTSFDRQLWQNYYIARRKYFEELSRYSIDSSIRVQAQGSKSYYENSLIENFPEQSELLDEVMITKWVDEGNYEQGYNYGLESLKHYDKSDHAYAKISFLIGVASECMGRKNEKRYWYAKAASVDATLAIMDHGALSGLVDYFIEVDNDIDLTMRYMRYIVNDAIFYNSKLRPLQVSRALVETEQAYNIQKEKSTRLYKIITLIVSLFVVILIVVILYISRQRRRLAASQLKLKAAYADLSSLNADLSSGNLKLLELNSRIAEANRVKEEYISNFFMICSQYIEQLDEYRRYVRKMLNTNKVDTLRRECDSVKHIERERQKFYELFDSTFMRLFPSFIEELNMMLESDAQFHISQKEGLNRELRVFALIRLGFNDSATIAALLNCSMSTIYNYRSKIKNSTVITKELFDERIKSMGELSQEG
ncbi:MAG: DUF6377 domain-containing protein [Rikenellaceae bacterium]